MIKTAASCNVKPAAMFSRAATDRSASSSPTLLLVLTKSTVAVSLSAIVTFCVVVDPKVSGDEGFEIASTAVSVPSTSVSS